MTVEIRDVAIPVALQDAMSRQAQAEREKQARVILGSAEAEIAGKFVEAAKIYAVYASCGAMNIIYETTKERGTTILIPMSMVDSMNPASALVLAGQGLRRRRPVAEERRLRIFLIADERRRRGPLRLVKGMHTKREKRSSKDRGHP